MAANCHIISVLLIPILKRDIQNRFFTHLFPDILLSLHKIPRYSPNVYCGLLFVTPITYISLVYSQFPFHEVTS